MAEIIRGRSEYHFREKNGNQKSFGKHRVVESPRNVSLLTRTKMKFLSKKREREREKKKKRKYPRDWSFESSLIIENSLVRISIHNENFEFR